MKNAFPNATFKSQNEYFEFVDKYHVYGSEAYRLKKAHTINRLKLKIVPETHQGSDDDFGISNGYKRRSLKVS